MKLFSRLKKGKERNVQPDGLPSNAIAEQPERVSLGENNGRSAFSLDIHQPWQTIPSNSRISGRIEKDGLFLLNPPDSQSNSSKAENIYFLDIVALHGINGHPYKTWTHENGKFWLRDFVPKGLPGARVFSFGYPAEVFLSLGTDDIDSYARSLLEDLKRERRKEVGSQFT